MTMDLFQLIYIFASLFLILFFFKKKGIRPCFDQVPFILIQWSENNNCLVCKIWGVSD